MSRPRRVAGVFVCAALLMASARCTLAVDTTGLESAPGETGGADANIADAGDAPIVDARIVRDGAVHWPVNGHSYELVVSPTALTWPAARDGAAALGGHLATLTSAAENDFVFQLVPGSSSTEGRNGPWIGGYQDPIDASPSEGWRWVTGEPWSFTNWASGAPDDDRGTVPEYYLHYFWASSRASTWHDAPPTASIQAFVVEYE